MGIREAISLERLHEAKNKPVKRFLTKATAYDPAPKKALPRMTIGGAPRPGGGTGRSSPTRTVRTQAANTDDMRDDGKTGDTGDLSYKVKVTGKPGGWQKGDQETQQQPAPVRTNQAAVKQIKDARTNKMGIFERIARESQYGKLRKGKCPTCDCTSHSGRCAECGCMEKSMRGTYVRKSNGEPPLWGGDNTAAAKMAAAPTCHRCGQSFPKYGEGAPGQQMIRLANHKPIHVDCRRGPKAPVSGA